jgi:hypothetical protein
MADLPISGLPAASSLTGTELFAVVQGGVTKYTTAQNINYVTSNNYGLFNQTGSSAPVSGSTHISGSLIDGGIGTLSVPANGFQKGDAFEAVMAGTIFAQNGDELDIQVRTDNVVLGDTGVITMAGADNQNWRLILNFSINEIGSANTAEIRTVGTFQYRKDASQAFVSEIFSYVNNTTFDTTIDNSLEVRAVWSGGATDAASIYSDIFTLKKTY